jgi:hypothetical protein
VVNRNATSPWPFVGMGGLFVALFPYLFLSFAAPSVHVPWWSTLMLFVFWVVLFVLGTRWWTPHPKRTLVLPVVAFAVLIGAAYAGGRWWGWTA